MERIVFLVERPTMPLSPRHRLELGEQRQRFSIEKRLSVTVERGSLRGLRNAPGGRPNLSWMGSQLIPRRSNRHLRRSRQNGLLRIAVATIGIAAGVSSPRCSSSSAFASRPHYGRARHRLSVHRLGNALMAKTSRSGAPAIGGNAHKNVEPVTPPWRLNASRTARKTASVEAGPSTGSLAPYPNLKPPF